MEQKKTRFLEYEKYAEIRSEKGMTDYQVAEKTGITKSTFSEWKSNRSEPKLDKVMKIAAVLGMSTDDFANAVSVSGECSEK